MLNLGGLGGSAKQRVDVLGRYLWSASLVAITLSCWLMLSGNDAHAAAARHHTAGTSTLAIRVSGLPPGVAGSIAVRGPHFSAALKGPRVIRRVRAGTYTFTVHRVRIVSRHRRVHAGSLALPTHSYLRVRVEAGRTTTVGLLYGTIVNSNVRRLSTTPAAVRGDPTNPAELIFRSTAHAGVGTILTAAPSSTLPAGLFHKVTAVHRSGRRIVLELEPARLTEAFPQLDIDSTLALSSGEATASQVHPAGFEPLVANLGIPNFRCRLPLADSTLISQQTFSIDAEVHLHIPTSFGVPVGLPNGKLALTFKASASLQAFIRKNTGCSALVNLPPLPGAIPVGPVVVPVYAEVGAIGSATIGSDLQAQANASFDVTAGMEFRGSNVHNISGASAHASASAGGAGKLAVGPSVRFAMGVAAAADVHLAASPSLAFTAALDGSCSLDLEAGSRAGISIGPFQLNENLPAPTANLYRCQQQTQLSIAQTAPLGAFPNQAFEYTLKVTNGGSATAHGVEIVDSLPGEGSFVSSAPGGSPTAPAAGGSYTIPLGDVPAGQTRTVTVRWRAPATPTSLTGSALVKAANAPLAGPATAAVPVGTTTNCNPCGATAAGTGLRNRDHGSITIDGVPSGASVGRAILIWGVLYDGGRPSDEITFSGHRISADVTSTVSGSLCWEDEASVGYAADVTSYVTDNGTFDITDPPRGETRVDESPYGALPYTDGATLVVFFKGGSANSQVLSDFSYDTNTDTNTGEAITREFHKIHSLGGRALLTLAGPDGQSNFGESFFFTGSEELEAIDTFNGSDHQDGPSFEIGDLWDTDLFDISSIVPAGQQTLTVRNFSSQDCVGLGAAVLQVAQAGG